MAETESSFTTSKSTNEPGLYLVPFRMEVNGSTGFTTWHCRIEEVDEQGNIMQGPVILHGIDTTSLNRRHKGSHEVFLMEKVKPEMLRHYQDFKQDHSEGKKLEGKRL